MNPNIAIIAVHDGKKTLDATWELLALAQKIPGQTPDATTLFFIGEKVTPLAKDFSAKSACPACAVNCPGANAYNPEVWHTLLAGRLKALGPRYVLAMNNTTGMDAAPGLSIALGGSCITGVEDIRRQDEETVFVRSMFGGKIRADFKSGSFPLVLTLAPGALKAVPEELNAVPVVTAEDIEYAPDRMISKGRLPSPAQGSGLSKAEVVVSGGRGIGSEENYDLIEQLAAEFPRSARGASRPVCDYRWVPYGRQVGATGTVVAPDLYIACGISGATQHLEGMRDSRLIVAVNTDPGAPIFRVADICIVEDLTEFIPLLIRQIRKKKMSIEP